METYNLQLVNNSSTPWTFYIYQTLPGQPSNIFPTVWFCSPYQMIPGTQIQFSWVLDYSMLWGQVGQIMPGVTFSAGQIVPADLQHANTSTFSVQPGPNLSYPEPGSPSDALIINSDGSVPLNQFAVGIGMNGTATFITNAIPSWMSVFIPDSPTYWVAAGANVQVGTVLDTNQISMNINVIFPPNVYQLTCILDQNNQWSVRQ